MKNWALIGLAGGLLLLRPYAARAETITAPPEVGPTAETDIQAGDADDPRPKAKQDLKWNQFDNPITTFKFGGGFLVDYAGYKQDSESKQQVRLEPDAGLRDARILMDGQFKTERKFTWCTGLMYDGPSHNWLIRQTGVMVGVPEAWSHFFIGRQKEGFSLNKAMVGYAGWTMERATISDATIPLLADGIKWMGLTPDHHIRWDMGYYGDAFSEGESFSTYNNQYIARLNWLPIIPEGASKQLLHLGAEYRYGIVKDGQLQLRSRPESFLSPYFLDTGKFAAHDTSTVGWEAYYRPGSWLFGTEYWMMSVNSQSTNDPLEQGGDLVATWLVTGETRDYNLVGGFFRQISPARSVFKGGPGAVELVLRESYADLNSGTVDGGKFWRLTPMINWYLSDIYRLEAAYGYGTLDRFGLQGQTQFFQLRLQIWV